MTTAIEKVGNVAIDYNAVLRTLKLNPTDPNTQALLVTCQAYELDPVLKHMVLIQGAPYVTHKGLWHIAHRSGLLDGHEIVEEGESNGEWFARVAIYRKDWSRPVTMKGRYPKGGTNKQYGQEMAVTRAECLVLRRLFDVALPVYEEINWRDRPARADEDANSRGAGGPIREDGRPSQEVRDTRPALPAPGTPEYVIVTSDEEGSPAPPAQAQKPRTFAPPSQSKQNTDAIMQQFSEADEKLCDPQELKALHKEIDSLDLEAATELSAAWKAAGLPSIKNKKTYDKAAYEQAMNLVLDAKSAMEERLHAERPFTDETGDAA